MPSILQDKKWNCPAAVELTRWMRMFRKKQGMLRDVLPIEFDTKEGQAVLTEVSNLQHIAVHRLPTAAKGVSRLLVSAMKLAQIL